MSEANDFSSDLVEYYNRRAPVYDRIYDRHDPGRQVELATVKQVMDDTFSGKRVLELACGTGYWTESLSDAARSVVAIDAAENALKLAVQRRYRCPVYYVRADLYHLCLCDKEFDGLLAGFWLSHVPRKRLSSHLAIIFKNLKPDGCALFFDNLYHPESGLIIDPQDGSSDTFKIRRLDDGSCHRVLKNYFSEKELREMASAATADKVAVSVRFGVYYWVMKIERK